MSGQSRNLTLLCKRYCKICNVKYMLVVLYLPVHEYFTIYRGHKVTSYMFLNRMEMSNNVKCTRINRPLLRAGRVWGTAARTAVTTRLDVMKCSGISYLWGETTCHYRWTAGRPCPLPTAHITLRKPRHQIPPGIRQTMSRHCSSYPTFSWTVFERGKAELITKIKKRWTCKTLNVEVMSHMFRK